MILTQKKGMKSMNELLKVNTDSGRITLSARELHQFLEVGARFNDWFPRMCEYGFNEHIDYEVLLKNEYKSNGGRPSTDYQITIEMAKEISMIQRNEKGKQARQYFIQLENDWNSPDRIMQRALLIANERVKALETQNKIQTQQIAELKPKADYTDDILKNKALVPITAIAKDYGMSGSAMNSKLHELGIQYKQSGQWFLYAKYQDRGYTHSETHPIRHTDGRESVKMNTKWTQKGRLFLYDVLKKNGIVPTIERS